MFFYKIFGRYPYISYFCDRITKNTIIMNKITLRITKCAVLFAMMFSSYDGLAQTTSQYIGENYKIYDSSLQGNKYMYAAHIIENKQSSFVHYLAADIITLIGFDSNYKIDFTYPITSKYGNFIEFCVMGSSKYTYKTMMLEYSANGTPIQFAITQKGSNLYLVNMSEETLVGTITNDFKLADDFQIYIIPYLLGDWKKNLIHIMNNGALSTYTFTDVINNNTSVNSPKVNDKEDATYSIDGKKVQTPHNSIFIKGGKKVIIK